MNPDNSLTQHTQRLALAIVLTATAGTVHGEKSSQDLAKMAQNPVSNLISVPIQNNTNLNYGPETRTQNILNIQPVYPVTLSEDWNLTTRTVMPLIWQPQLSTVQDSTFGLGDIQFSAFLSPNDASSGLV